MRRAYCRNKGEKARFLSLSQIANRTKYFIWFAKNLLYVLSYVLQMPPPFSKPYGISSCQSSWYTTVRVISVALQWQCRCRHVFVDNITINSEDQDKIPVPDIRNKLTAFNFCQHSFSQSVRGAIPIPIRLPYIWSKCCYHWHLYSEILSFESKIFNSSWMPLFFFPTSKVNPVTFLALLLRYNIQNRTPQRELHEFTESYFCIYKIFFARS